MVDKTLLI